MNTFRRVCIATSYAAISEPRSPRYAAAIARMLPHAEVLFVDCLPIGVTSPEPADFEGLPNLRRHTIRFAWRGGRAGPVADREGGLVFGPNLLLVDGLCDCGCFLNPGYRTEPVSAPYSGKPLRRFQCRYPSAGTARREEARGAVLLRLPGVLLRHGTRPDNNRARHDSEY